MQLILFYFCLLCFMFVISVSSLVYSTRQFLLFKLPWGVGNDDHPPDIGKKLIFKKDIGKKLASNVII